MPRIRKREGTCTRCDLHRTCRTVCIPADGPDDGVDVLFIGEAPGQKEDEEGIPFVGESGQLLRDTVKEVLPDLTVRYTNAVRCRPPGNATPTAKHWKPCQSYLIEEILHVRPRALCTLGAVSLRSTLGLGGVTRRHGTVHSLTLGGEEQSYPVVVCVHPAYVLRGGGVDLEAFHAGVRLLERVLRRSESAADYRVLNDPELIAERLSHSRRLGRPVAFDYETTGFDPWTQEVLCVSLSQAANEAFCFDPALDPKAWRSWLKSDVPKVVHNAAFEGVWSQHHFGVFPKNIVHDTMLGERLTDENRSAALEQLAYRYTDAPPFKAETQDIDWSQAAMDQVWRRNAADADYTLQVMKAQGAVPLMAQSLVYTKVLTQLRIRGVRLDQERLTRARETVHEELSRVASEIRAQPIIQMFEKNTGKVFNPNSSQQCGEVLCGYAGLQPLERGKTGPSTDANFRKYHRGAHPLVDLIDRWKELDQQRKNYFDKWEGFVRGDGRVHPSWNVGGTVTFRLSCAEPNLQNVPSSAKRCVVADDGHVLIEADYGQIELVVVACLSREETLLRAFREGADPHRATAAQLYGIDEKDVSESQRAIGKKLNFGSLYGITHKGLWIKFGIPEQEGKEMLKRYWTRMEGVAAWAEQQKADAVEHGEVRSPFGRVRHFTIPKARDNPETFLGKMGHIENQAVNFPVQSAAAELTLRAMVLLETHLPEGAHTIMQVHDSIIVECPEEKVEEATEAIHRCMTTGVMQLSNMDWLDLPLRVDMKVGQCWGEMTEYAKTEER